MSKITTVLQPGSGMFDALQFKECWRYRELLYFLTWRDVKVRYKQAVLGIAWVVLQPLMAMLVFTIFFGRVAKIPSDGIPYPLFTFAAMLPWTYFSTAITRGSSSLVGSAGLITKVYFPRILVPLSGVIGGLVDYAIATGLLFLLLLYYGIWPTADWLIAFPFLTLQLVLLAFGMSLWLGALNVRYRDISYLLPFGMQLWMFATPIVYPRSMIPEKYLFWVDLNPLAGVIEGFRSLLIGKPWDVNSLVTGLVMMLVFLVSGFWYFSKTERRFADIV